MNDVPPLLCKNSLLKMDLSVNPESAVSLRCCSISAEYPHREAVLLPV